MAAMTRLSVAIFSVALLVALWAPSALAFETYAPGNCANCHGDFRDSPYISLSDGSNWGDDLHDVHRNTMLDGDCDTCHSSGSRSPVSLYSSVGGSGLDPISCVGCHGREGDRNTGPFGIDHIGAGLRQHHENAGAASCGGCHSDNNPATFATTPESELPPYYLNPGTGHPNMPTNPCNAAGEENFAGSALGLDNDGDGDYDSADADCSSNAAPTADPGGPYSADAGAAISFDGSGSTDDGTIVEYSWDFGDGTALGMGVAPTHTYGAAGTYTVTLTVTDDGGLTDSATTQATITAVPPPNQAPTANANGPYSAQTGNPINFSGAGSSDPDGSIVAYDWDFGDGSTGTGVNPTHSYGAEGTYTVTLTVTDDGSPALTGTNTTTATITAVPPPNQAPTADPNGPYNAQVGDPVNFDGTGSSDPDGSIVAYDWDFGDGNMGAGINATHAYGAAGTYTVILTVTDSGGLSDTATTTAVVDDKPTDGDGEALYNAWCLGCHGDFDQPNQASSIKVLGARSCSIDAAINGNPAAGGDTPYPDGVPEMQFMQGVLSGPNVDAISAWMNESPVSAAQRYTTTCASCHGADGSGGFVAGDIRGKGNNVRQAILAEESMKFLSCLPEWEITAHGDFLGRELAPRARKSGSGATGPAFLLLLGWAVFIKRRRK